MDIAKRKSDVKANRLQRNRPYKLTFFPPWKTESVINIFSIPRPDLYFSLAMVCHFGRYSFDKAMIINENQLRRSMVAKEKDGIKELIAFAMDAVREAGDTALTYYGKGRHKIQFDMRLVIETELRLTEVFRTHLTQTFPQHQIFDGHSEMDGYTHKGKRYMWIFDPLDGVANFQAGIPIWCVSLALLDNFWPILGVIYLPATGDFFHAQAGQKAFLKDTEIRTTDQDAINDESVCLTFSRFHQYYHTSFPGKIRNLGCTGAHISYVAMGRADAAVVANESFKDLAAARVLIEAAGGKIYKLDGGEFFLNEYMDGDKIGGHLLITSEALCNQVGRFIKPVS
jgi:myo-inositol-1(or 4)-monophosphatase